MPDQGVSKDDYVRTVLDVFRAHNADSTNTLRAFLLLSINRRNTALTGALWGSLAQKFRNRVQHLKSASEIWSVLESSCLPHGSEDGYKLYLELHDVTHADSDDLKSSSEIRLLSQTLRIQAPK